MTATTVFIGIGSNVGDRITHMREGCQQLQEMYCQITKTSPVYETTAMYVEDQPDYLNAVVQIETSSEPDSLLALLKIIEQQHGRSFGGRKHGPRTLDLDILLFGDMTHNTKDLVIPHPMMQERAFVLYPLCDIASKLKHPTLNTAMWSLKENLGPQDGIQKTDLKLL